MIKSILRFLGGEGGEDKQMLLLLGKGFFMGIMLATYKVGAETLFISVIGEKYLSEAFFFTGVLGIIFTAIFVSLQKKINYSSLVTTMTFIILLIIVGSRVAFHINGYQEDNVIYERIVFGLFVMLGPVMSITLLGFWGIFGRIFDLKQQKRIIGGIDTGQLFATLIAFFSVPLLTRTIIDSTHDLLVVSSVAAVGVFVFTILLSVNFNLDRVTKIAKGKKAAKVTYLDLIRNKYLRLLSIFLIFSMGASIFANYTFITSTETWFKLDDETLSAVDMEKQKLLLSDFLSFFNGAIIILSFVIQSFINDFIIGKFGLKIALMTMPFILALFTIGAIISGHIFTYDIRTEEYILFFLFTASAKLFTDSLKDALENPAFKLFFLPIEIQKRFDIQTRVEGVVNEFAKLSAGAMQIGLGVLAFFELIHYSYFILAMAGMVVWLASRLFTQYKSTLKETLQKQRDELKDEGKKNEHSTINVLKGDVKSRDVDTSFHALKILEKLDPIEFEYVLLDMINSRNAEIRKHAYTKLNEYLCFDALEIIEREAATEGDEGALAAANETLNALREAANFQLADVSIRKLVRSTEASERAKAARLLIKASEDRHISFLVELLRDINPQVRTAAIITAGKVRRPELWTVLVENLHLATYGNVAMSALTAAGDATFHTIDSAFYKTGQYLPTMLRIVQLMGRIGGRQSTELLWKKIDFPDKKIVSELLLSLSYQGFRGKEFQSSRINLMVEAEIGDVAWNIKVLDEIPKHTEYDTMIRQAFAEEDKGNQANIFMLLGMMYDPQNVLLVRENIEIGTIESISFAIEMLDVFVHEGLKPKLFPILDEMKSEDKLAKLQNHYPPEYFESYEDLLLQIVNRDYNRVNRYTKALAMYRLSQLSKTVTMDMIANLFNPDHLLLETAAYTIYTIDKDAYQKHTRRLRPMTKKELDKAILPPVFKDEDEIYHQKMLLVERVILLKRMDIFSSISGQQITHLAESMEEILVSSGTQLIEEGEGGNAPIYILLEGKLEVRQGGEKVREVGLLEIVGEKLLLETDMFDFSVVSTESCKLLVLRKEELLDLMSLHLDIVEAMLEVLKGGTESIEDENTMEVFV
ncbi:MAG: cyclic nucleotide-binding domain-containing protein [Cytophagales bacterium]|nr:cyclic nucleotide-binding domain-containing protein [Cytophagales bacterium]